MKEIIYEGCVDGDTPSVSWKPETPDHASGYKSQKAPIRVILESSEQVPGRTYKLVCRYSVNVQPFSGESTVFYSTETLLTAPIGVPVKVFTGSSVSYDGSGRTIHSSESLWMVSSPGTEYVYDESGDYVYTEDGEPETRSIVMQTRVGSESVTDYFERPEWGTVFGQTSLLSAELLNYDGSIAADLLSDSPIGTILTIETYDGEADNPEQTADDAYWLEVFRMNFTKAPENIQVDCDCESDCVKVYRNNQEEFFCICREEEDKDLTANKDRIKQEVKAELFPVLKEQVKSEVKPEVKSELKEDEGFKDSIRDAVKEALRTDEAFQTEIKELLKSDEDFKNALIAAVKKDSGTEGGYTFETAIAGSYELTIRLKNGIPNRVSLPMQPLPWEEDPVIPQTINEKYSRTFVIGAYQAIDGQLVAPLS
jgi:hypothetical protein